MWLITDMGFFSVTAFDPRRGGQRTDAADLLVIRARVREDLERIAPWIGDEILDTPRADYPFRVITSRSRWISYLEAATNDIHYLNFKDRVASRLGSQRHDVLLSVWGTLRRLQRQP